MITKSEYIRIAKFTLVLLIMLAFSYGMQVGLFGFSPNQNMFNEAYLFNGFFALASFVVLVLLSRVFPGITGFAFMVGSGLKFLVFFSVFYPVYHADGQISSVEFASFFVPYAIALCVELLLFVKN